MLVYVGSFATCDFPDYAFEGAHFFEEGGKDSGIAVLGCLHAAEDGSPLGLPELCTFAGIVGLDVLSFLGPAAVSVEEDEEFEPRDPSIAAVGIDGGPSSVGEESMYIDVEVMAMRKSVCSWDRRRQ